MENDKVTKTADFERKIADLQKIVDKLEKSDVSLEDSMALYERGLELTKDCVRDLNTLSERIAELNDELDTVLAGELDE